MNDSTQTSAVPTAAHSSHVRDAVMGVLAIAGICLLAVIVFTVIGVGAGLILGVL